MEANALPGADTITVPAGTYVLTLGALGIFDDVTITGAGSATTIIDGNAQDRVIDLASFVVNTVDISGVTIRNGRAQGFGSGAGIHVNVGHTLNLTDVVVTENHSTGSSGGIHGNLGPVTLTNSVISNNTADFSVGGINGSTLTIVNSAITGNSSFSGSGGGVSIGGATGGPSTISGSTITNNFASSHGGGTSIGKAVTITNSTISGNTGGGKGGGIQVSAESVSLTDVTIADNTVTGSFGGGGIYNECCALALNNVTVVGNVATAGPGGGILYGFGVATTTLTNSTISGNSAATNGGGIAIVGLFSTLPVELNNVTITGNTADSDGNGSGDGGGAYREPTVGTLNFKNTIIAGNADLGGQAPDCSGGANGELTSQGYNLIQNTTGCGIIGDTTGNITGQDPLLGPLANNGGPTETHALTPGSPAIDTGNPAVPGSGGNACEATDQRGVARPLGAACDIGAYEAEPPPPPSCTIDLVLTYTGGNLNMDLSMSSNVATTWKILGVVGGSLVPLLSADLPVIPAWSPSLSFPLSPMGTVGILTALITPAEGALCFDFETVNTGAPAVSGQGLDGLRRSFAETQIGP